jgi:thioredoxin reductase (NADPH)
MHDVVIIGSGPAGCTAGIFAVRRNLKTLILSDPMELSQAEEAPLVDDWPGEPEINGMELVKKFRDHTKKLGAEIREERITEISKIKEGFIVKSAGKSFEARTVIYATGAKHRKGLVKGEEALAGKGVSYCASCDGPLYKGKRVLVLGGGDTAVSYALLLEQIGADTTLVHRRDELRAAEAWQKKIKNSKVKILWSTLCLELKGKERVESAVLMNKKTQKKEEVKVDGVFVAFGTVPTSEIAKNVGIKLDDRGYILVDRNQKTNIDGIFAAGDCCDNPSKKIVTAAGDGAIAAESAYSYIKGNG